jgi:hypothetical protein
LSIINSNAMTRSIADKELDAELQELYLTDKHWISDLDFLETEIIFLLKFSKTSTRLPHRNDLKRKISSLIHSYNILKAEVLNFLARLAPITIAAEKKIDITLIEDHSRLKIALEELLQNFQTEKKAIFGLSTCNQSLKQSDHTGD